MDESDSYVMLGIYCLSSTHGVFGASFVNELWPVRVDDSEAASGSESVWLADCVPLRHGVQKSYASDLAAHVFSNMLKCNIINVRCVCC